MPDNGYGWFHHPTAVGLKQNQDGLPESEDNAAISGITKTYSLLPNRGENEKTPMLYPGPMETGVTAGTINIDIPFDMLSKTAISPEASLDRQIAANLRLKCIIDEYLALKKRSEQVLNGLGIPYLKRKDTAPSNWADPVPEEIKAEKQARITMENVIVFSESGKDGDTRADRQDVVFQETGTYKEDREKIMPEEDIDRSQPSPEYPGNNSYQTSYGSNTELPWFFSFVLKLISYAVRNKVEIFLWAGILLICGLLGMLAVKQ